VKRPWCWARDAEGIPSSKNQKFVNNFILCMHLHGIYIRQFDWFSFTESYFRQIFQLQFRQLQLLGKRKFWEKGKITSRERNYQRNVINFWKILLSVLQCSYNLFPPIVYKKVKPTFAILFRACIYINQFDWFSFRERYFRQIFRERCKPKQI